MDGLFIEDDFDHLAAVFDRMAGKAEDMRRPLTDAGEAIRYEVEFQFDTEGGLTAEGHWEYLSPEYEAWKGRSDILVLSDQLHQDAVGAEVIVIDNVMEYGIDNWLAPLHQAGAMRQKGGRLPARPIVVLAESTQEDIEDHFVSWIEEDVIEDVIHVSGYSYERNGRIINVSGYTRRRSV